MNFRKTTKPLDPEKKQDKNVLKNLYDFCEGRGKFLNAFDSKIFPIKTKALVI